MEKTDIKNLLIPDPWMAELPSPQKTGNEVVTSWNAVPLFFNVPEVSQQPAGYRATTVDDAKDFLFIDIAGHETLEEFMKNYWFQLSNGKFSFGINYAKNDDGSLLIADIDLGKDDGTNISIDKWEEIITLHLKESAEKVWKAGNSLITPDGKRWIPAVFLVNRNTGRAFARFGKIEIESNGKTYILGDRHVIRYNFNIFEADGTTLTDDENKVKSYWGTIAHEFSHNFAEQGDLYGPAGAIGYWDLLGDGGTYGRMSEICSLYKFAADWLTFKEQIFGPSYQKKSLELSAYTTSHEAYLVMPDPHRTPHEFFLLEYRKSTGSESWRPDGKLPEEGLLIFHINTMFPMYHTPWNRREAPPIDVEMANFLDKGTTLRIYFDKVAGNLFPQAGNNKFTPYSQPSSNFYGHRSSGLEITNIRVEGEKLKFDLEIKGYSQTGWIYSNNDNYITGRFSNDSITEGAEIVAWNNSRFAMLHERECQFISVYSSRYDLGGFPLRDMELMMSGDFDGDGLDELYIRTNDYNALLKFRHGRFERIQQYLALWDPKPGDREYSVKVLSQAKHQLLLLSNNDFVLWQYTAGELEGMAHHNGTIGQMTIDSNLQVFPVYMRSIDFQDLILFNGNKLSVVHFNESSRQFDELAFFDDRIDSWNLGSNDKLVPADLDGDDFQEIFIRSASWMGFLKWQNNTLELVYIKHNFVNHSNGDDANKVRLNANDLLLKGKFRPERDGIYHINGNRVYQLLWDDIAADMKVHRHVEGGSAGYDTYPDDQYIVADFHRIGEDINVSETGTFKDFNADHFTDIFVANPNRAVLLSPNYVPEGAGFKDEFSAIWRLKTLIPLLNPGSTSRSVVAEWEDWRGRNQRFLDLQSGAYFSRELFVNMIEEGLYPDYHIREINGVKTPVSNPNRYENDNLERD